MALTFLTEINLFYYNISALFIQITSHNFLLLVMSVEMDLLFSLSSTGSVFLTDFLYVLI